VNGHMRVLLISANTEKINLPTFPLGLACVAQATLDRGHDVEWLDLMAERNPEAAVKRHMETLQPQVIGISVRNIDDQNMANPRFLLEQAKDVVKFCKSVSESPIVLGGAGYSLFPDSSLDYLEANMGVQGEGESSFPLLMEALERGRPRSGVPGLYLRGQGLQGERRFAEDLDSLPLPDPKLFSTSAYEGEDFWIPVQTRRGCALRCSYCSTETIEGHALRKRSPEQVVRWMARWVESGFSRFQFVDNTFNLPPSYALILCSRLAEADIPVCWRSILYPTKLDKTLVEAMAKSGCREVSLGFESGCDDILKEMNKHFMSKDVREAARMLSDHGIHIMGFLMLGGPGETRDTVEETLAFVNSLNLDALKITIGIRIYPQTKLAKVAIQDGLIAPDEELLFPRFYMVKGLEVWLRETVAESLKEHPNWMM
jgi:radical SAM superfamily enzyme YgiQ (UPF0313 family)